MTTTSAVSAREIGARAGTITLLFPPGSRRRSGRGAALAEVLRVLAVMALAPTPVAFAVARGVFAPSALLRPPTPWVVRSFAPLRCLSLRLQIKLKIDKLLHRQVRVRLLEFTVFREFSGHFLEVWWVRCRSIGKGR